MTLVCISDLNKLDKVFHQNSVKLVQEYSTVNCVLSTLCSVVGDVMRHFMILDIHALHAKIQYKDDQV